MLGELDKEYTLAGQLEEAGAELTVRGRYEEAIPVLEGALTVSRKLADRNHGPVELILVAPFNNHGFCLLKLRRLPEALRSFQEAIAIADRHPGEASDDVVGPAFAAALMSAASILGELGQADRAMEITNRLVVLRRALPAPENLPADPELAKGLRMFALVRGATGLELERALSVAREATSLYEQLATTSTGRLRPGAGGSVRDARRLARTPRARRGGVPPAGIHGRDARTVAPPLN